MNLGLNVALNDPLSFVSDFDQFNRSSIPLVREPNSNGATIDYILRIVAQADHDVLLRSGNEAYAKMLNELDGSKAEVATVRCVVCTNFVSSLFAKAIIGPHSRLF